MRESTVAKLDEQISTLQERLTRLKVRQQHIDARKRAIAVQRERKTETRRKVLLGALILQKAKEGQMDAQLLRSWLDQALTRADERALFDLPPLAVEGGGTSGVAISKLAGGALNVVR
jgi:large subunit ribosomal protein L7/L12